uniref:Translin-associated factor X-interacting protein 1 N-terminal domain-containing protein n=1 Tax=Lates calcarifer TaxID=8187 RepID=A0A4W6D397_LATCA
MCVSFNKLHNNLLHAFIAMSSSCKPKPRCFGSDIHRLLQAAEAGQKADILTLSSGHLGPRSLNQSQPHTQTNQSFWKMSRSQEETPNPLALQQRRTKALTYVKKKEMKESPPEFTVSTGSEVSESGQDRATGGLSHADRREDISLPKIVDCSSNSLPFQPRAFSQKKPNSSSDPEGKQQFCSSHSDHEGLNNEDQLKTKQWFGRQFIAKQDPWAGINVAEMHERKLQKELKKLSVQSWPSRDRLAVFSDVFDDVCESSPVFGRILREIKVFPFPLYPLTYVVVLLQSLNTSLEGLDNSKVREMELEDAEKEVSRLEEEARRSLQCVHAWLLCVWTDVSLSGLQDSGTTRGTTNSIQFKKLQVLNLWQEIQQLEEEIKERMVSTVTTTATERRIKEIKVVDQAKTQNPHSYSCY